MTCLRPRSLKAGWSRPQLKSWLSLITASWALASPQRVYSSVMELSRLNLRQHPARWSCVALCHPTGRPRPTVGPDVSLRGIRPVCRRRDAGGPSGRVAQCASGCHPTGALLGHFRAARPGPARPGRLPEDRPASPAAPGWTCAEAGGGQLCGAQKGPPRHHPTPAVSLGAAGPPSCLWASGRLQGAPW